MTPIQVLLLLCLAGAFFLYWKLFQNRFLNRLLLLGAFCITVLLVIRPGISTWLANRIGVGRGTDLILYVSIVTLIFVLLMMYAKIKKLEEMVTTLLREQGLKQHRDGNNG